MWVTCKTPGEHAMRRGRDKGRNRRLDPWKDRSSAIEEILHGVVQGQSLRKAAAAAGVHQATVYRWGSVSKLFADVLRAARADGRNWVWAQQWHCRRPRVSFSRDCPRCGCKVVIYKRFGPGGTFWRCSKWPACLFASWRPRAQGDCPACGGARFWSHSRKSIACEECKH